MDFRLLPPHWLQDIDFRLAGPHIRFKKLRNVSSHHPLPSCCNSVGNVLLFLFSCELPQAVCGVLGPRYSSFLDKIDQIIRAFLFAMATATTFGCRRSRIWLIQTLLASSLPPAFPRTALAPWIKSVRRYRSPRLLIPNNRDFPPLDRCLGTKPNQAANWRPFLKQD